MVTDPTDDLQLYDKSVAAAVKASESAGLKADGMVGKGLRSPF